MTDPTVPARFLDPDLPCGASLIRDDLHGPPRYCARPAGHRGSCRRQPLPRESRERCGAPCPNSDTPCARWKGHAGGKGGGHRTAWALEADRVDAARRYAARKAARA